MKTLFIQVLDPSGHSRQIKVSEFPSNLGNRLLEKNQLRDHSLCDRALQIEQCDGQGFVLKSLQKDLMICLGDLKFQAMEIPFFVKLKVGQTELCFSQNEPKEQVIEFPRGEQAWHTESASGVELLSSVRKSSDTNLSIYLSGETGTGKEVLARLVHVWSRRSTGAFVAINCGALTVSLAESELFGHVKGSYTGAIKDRPGALLQAHGGTLFLDEVGDLPLELQVKLLRFLENGEIRPVGSDRTLFADVRVVCATHKPLLQLVQEGKFRQDLYFRLASIPIQIPSLRRRVDDIRALALQFAKKHDKTLTKEAVQRLQSHSWPGNVRELSHAVERACGLAGRDASVIHSSDFDFLNASSHQDSETQFEFSGLLKLKDMEKILILKALKTSKGNRADAAKLLGIARSTLFEMMKRHQIAGPKSTDIWLEHLHARY